MDPSCQVLTDVVLTIISKYWLVANCESASVCLYTLNKVGGGGVLGGSENQSISGVTTICLTQCSSPPLHRVDQVVDCGLWNVSPLLFKGCAKLLDIGYWLLSLARGAVHPEGSWNRVQGRR